MILTGSIGVMAYAFADYAVGLWRLDVAATAWLALSSVAALTLINLMGVVAGKSIQNLLSVVKVAGLLVVIVVGLGWGGEASQAIDRPIGSGGFGLAMVFVLFAYGGWNDAAFVAAEVRDVNRNIPRALLLGIAGITLIYLLVNGAYLWALGFEGVRSSRTPAADTLNMLSSQWGARAMSVLVMLSALGAINGLIFTGSRIHLALGADHRLFALLGRWHPRLGTPVWALMAQGLIACLLIVAVGTELGRGTIDKMLAIAGLSPLPWEEYYGGFGTLVAGTAPVFWAFFLLTGISVFVLRFKDPNRSRPFRVPLYPLTPIVFCLTSTYMLHASIVYAKTLSLIGIVPLAIGLPLYFASNRFARMREMRPGASRKS